MEEEGGSTVPGLGEGGGREAEGGWDEGWAREYGGEGGEFERSEACGQWYELGARPLSSTQ